MKKKKQNGITVPKIIIYTAKGFSLFSKKLTAKFCIHLFTTPTKHKTPKREWEMVKKSRKESLFIPKINKPIVVYHYGNSPRKVLLVHGWSGRGTQLFKIADELLKMGYSTISYDAPGHGESKSSSTLITDFIACNFELEKQFGPFDYAVGHSLGGMSLLNSVKRGLKIKKMVTIGAADRIIDILHSFVKQLELKPEIAELMKQKFETNFGKSIDNYDAAGAAKQVTIPTLVIHDKDDYEVPIICGQTIYNQLPDGFLIETEKLGHRKILGDDNVIRETVSFLI
ncbi:MULTISPECIES: alpha/beta fold hydrolase [Flavobacterium]|uniref:Alpha/beta fold hydrolase n=2 Tax=Flavobacterium TaxID=237 RepID=A0AA94F0H5_9FLAO|nr:MULTISPECIES: alpha/beta fold hydrolase [Flavobacterium]AMA49286.1 alpha/beta hydrolase [Flavobacterium covae]AND62987.1 alpha/beta hydrolase [Flavobacterium covae]MCH4828538.1 alpha/beta fold hydrolase [Flavobacterium columnare]MCH4831791.1 alpha/beta fold hydrolase [Flavobacterium columnare]MCJ1805359.1 alpha/beta hydrolase [Flavobacterium covae]